MNKNIQFTCEYETNQALAYLDLKIQRNNNNTISTNYFQKPTNKGRILHYMSNHPKSQKKGIVYGLISRIFTLSSEEYKTNNKKRIFQFLMGNGYPKSLIQHQINQFEQKSRTRQIQNHENLQETKETIKYRGITYIQGLSEKLTTLFQKQNKHLKIGHKPLKTNQGLYGTCKDKLDNFEKTDVVYAINCNDCEGKYIGMTSQKLKMRISQHQSEHKQKNKQNGTAAAKHAQETGHTFNFAETKILATEPNYRKRSTKEMLYIDKHKDKTLNFRTDTENLHTIYTQLLHSNTRK